MDRSQSRPIDKVMDRLYIGDINAVSDNDLLNTYNITHIVNCAADIDIYHTEPRKYIHVGLRDSHEDLTPFLEPCYIFIAQALKNPKTNVLVHCRAGKSRSASIVIYFLMRKYIWTYTKAFNYLKQRRPLVEPNESYAAQLSRFKH